MPVARVGVEGTGSYGAGLARHLRRSGVEVVEVDRPNRQSRRRTGKSDPADAIEAARAALSGARPGRRQDQRRQRGSDPGACGGQTLGPLDAKIKALNQIRNLVFTAPEDLREQLTGLSPPGHRRHGGGAPASPARDPVGFATRTALRTLGRRVLALDAEKAGLDEMLGRLVEKTAPELLGRLGVGVDTAATLLVTAGDNPGRLRSEAAWAHLCGVAPIQASSGKVTRAASTAAATAKPTRLCGASSSPACRPTNAPGPTWSAALDEGRSKPEIIRVLKRYVAREVYRYLPRP